MTYITATDAPVRNTGQIKLHGPEAFEAMRRAGQLTAQALDLMAEEVRPGVTTKHLDDLAYEFAHDHGAVPAPLFYRGFPASICTSINHVVCHGIPSEKRLKDGDILNIDVTCILDGWFGDSSRMFVAGRLNRKAERLIQVTH
ncbi:MAG: M24 family metallopeptidase, partial [Fimbriimonadaceae bacterium]|nr:M24 family metallopeptidase [Alphaproteobacteria bacterium]